MKQSIVKKYQLLSLLSGCMMGIVFPFFSLLFVADFKSKNSFLFFTLACIGAGLMVGLISFLIGKLTVLNCIKKVSDGLYTIAEADGDLTRRVEIRSEDIIGDLGKNFNNFIGKIQSVIKTIIIHSDHVSIASKHFSDSAEVMTDETAAMSENVTTMTSLATKSNDNIQLISVATDQISNSIHIMSDGVLKLNDSFGNILLSCRKEISIVAEADEKMKHGGEIMRKMEQTAESISSSVVMIHQIAQNIDLLALNARIEAARAGSSGRGFIVVAQEVKRLAGTTSKVTSEISLQVNQIKDIVQAAVEIIGDLSSHFVNVHDLSHEIENAVEGQYSTSEEIASQVKQVSLNTAEVKKKVDNTVAIFAEAAAAIGKVHQSISTASEGVHSMGLNASDLHKSTAVLRQEMTVFKV